MRRTDLNVRVIPDLDPDLLDFLTTYIDSFIKWDLLRFFYENPNTMDTTENIARYTGRAAKDVQVELQALTRRGMLKTHQIDEMVVYTLTPDDAMRERLGAFVQATKDRDFRRKVIYYMVKR